MAANFKKIGWTTLVIAGRVLSVLPLVIAALIWIPVAAIVGPLYHCGGRK